MSPFELKDPSAPPDMVKPDAGVEALTPEERDVLGVDDRERTTFLVDLRPIESRVTVARAESLRATEAELAEDRDAGLVRGAVRPFRAAWETFNSQRAAIEADRGITTERKGELTRKASDELRAKVAATADRTVGAAGDSVEARYRPKGLRRAEPFLAADVTRIHSLYGLARPATFAGGARADLDIATDASRTDEERFWANHRLRDGWLPGLDRRAKSPEPFARDWAPAYARLAEAVERHLATVTGQARYGRAAEMVEHARNAFTAMDRMTSDAGDFDEHIMKVAFRDVFDFD